MVDHILFVGFAIGFPVLTGPVYLRRRTAMLAGDPSVRTREYVETIAWLSAMGLVTVGVWLALGRNLSDIGLGLGGGWRFATALAAVAGIIALLCVQVRAARTDPEARALAREALEPVREFFPTSRVEARLFRGVSFAAGIGEEIYYRGFLIWYLAGAASVPWAVVLSSLLFGLAHWMHGTQATLRSTATGAVLAGIYLFSGSLWAPMLLHTAIDLTSGETGMAAFSGDNDHSRPDA